MCRRIGCGAGVIENCLTDCLCLYPNLMGLVVKIEIFEMFERSLKIKNKKKITSTTKTTCRFRPPSSIYHHLPTTFPQYNLSLSFVEFHPLPLSYQPFDIFLVYKKKYFTTNFPRESTPILICSSCFTNYYINIH